MHAFDSYVPRKLSPEVAREKEIAELVRRLLFMPPEDRKRVIDYVTLCPECGGPAPCMPCALDD